MPPWCLARPRVQSVIPTLNHAIPTLNYVILSEAKDLLPAPRFFAALRMT